MAKPNGNKHATVIVPDSAASAAAKAPELSDDEKAEIALEARREAIIGEYDLEDFREHFLVREVIQLMLEVPKNPKPAQRVYAVRRGAPRIGYLTPPLTQLDGSGRSVETPGVSFESAEDIRLKAVRRGNEDPVRVLRVARQDPVTRANHPISGEKLSRLIEDSRFFKQKLIIPWSEYCADRMDEVTVEAGHDKRKAERAERRASGKRGQRAL